MTMRDLSLSRRFLVAFAAALVCAAAAVSAQPGDAVLADAGELYRLDAGLYGELFPGASDHAAETPVLALTIDRHDGAPERLLVPGTGDARVERGAVLLHEPGAGAAFALWRSAADEGPIELRFASFDGAEFSEVAAVERAGAPAELAAPPQMRVTRDRFDLEIEEQRVTSERTVIHLLWQANEDGTRVSYYTPLLLVEGLYVGWNDSIPLTGGFFGAPEERAEESAEPAPSLTPQLAAALSLAEAEDAHSIVVAFANPASDRLGAIEIAVLPLELAVLGDEVRAAILGSGVYYDPGDPEPFSDIIRAEIIIIGGRHRLNQAVTGYVADRVGDWILAAEGFSAGDHEALGEAARDYTIDVTGTLYARTLTDPTDGSDVIEIDLGGLFDSGPQPAQILDVRVRADRPAPPAAAGPTALYPSADGRDLLVVWDEPAEDGGVLRYVESRGGAWTEPRALPYGDALSRGEAHRLLRERIR